jgi:hypothetical protein
LAELDDGWVWPTFEKKVMKVVVSTLSQIDLSTNYVISLSDLSEICEPEFSRSKKDHGKISTGRSLYLENTKLQPYRGWVAYLQELHKNTAVGCGPVNLQICKKMQDNVL